MTLDRRFSYLKGECRKWLDEEIELESELAPRANESSRQDLPDGEQAPHRLGSLPPSQPLARLGDVVSL
ncbi:MAG TPA: hypothetical protein VHO25_18615 [Polyangiaceae bacterium]|nr:hypothetical protein [Polyangiaceae bacterium]